MIEFYLDCSYSQIAIFDWNLENPFCNWTDKLARQGFAWREGSCSFRTLIEGGIVSVIVVKSNEVAIPSDCIRAISVPFSCQPGGILEVASIGASKQIKMEQGRYQLVFETGFRNQECWCRFEFVKNGMMTPSILIQDASLNPSFPLILGAAPA